ncbi:MULTISPECIES: hypothetical protein [Acetobacter]|uniref:NADH:quinone oxidoreductase/Mrp antiporter membrane subunit domain-containing protein n=1 Tax=Acetobacter thailandicus TaxID=1502842 RepID=A0ABT3QEW5_9PROT|nr:MULTISPECIES: hypothetical protein [Acetobacter]MBS0959959.1 hypothetical protein [Acetobacter thailandicus]MBS0979288.1 hypothetical protein [Acetobacter thailandicus]MCX2563818.1 hypothetical protein [Acetobacter thailandicus]NHN95108.1 hypothetical protein [Acetobacter thailandicus]OUJ09860.1 hypothetical protein HK25_09675 [Acetobacter sp. DsW_059]
MTASLFFAALSFVWPFLGAVLVAMTGKAQNRRLSLWAAGIACLLSVVVFLNPGTVASGWDDDPVQRAGRVMLAFGLLMTVLEQKSFQTRLLRSLPYVSVGLADLACITPEPVVGLGLLGLSLVYGVFVIGHAAGKAMVGWRILRSMAVGLFLVLAGLLLPPGKTEAGIMLACGSIVLAGLVPFSMIWAENVDLAFFRPFVGAVILLSLHFRAAGGDAFHTTLIIAGLVSLWFTAVSTRGDDKWYRFYSFPLALAFIAVGARADVAALLFLCGWCLAGGTEMAKYAWAARALACQPPGAPFVGCLLLFSVLSDMSWMLTILTIGGILGVILRVFPKNSGDLSFWPHDSAGRVACVVLVATGFMVPLAMMLGVF